MERLEKLTEYSEKLEIPESEKEEAKEATKDAMTEFER